MMVRRLKGVILIAVIILSFYAVSVPPALADFVVNHASFPPDFPGDVNYDGIVDVKDFYKVAQHYGATFGSSNWDPRYDLNDDGSIDVKDLYALGKLYGATYSSACFPVAYSTDFEFDVPFDGDETVWYYLLVRIYVPPELSQSEFIFVEDAVNDWVLNVRIDNQLKYTGSTSDTPCPVRNVTLGNLNQGFHLLEFYFVEKWAAGYVRFHVRTADGGYAWLDRFRMYVPNYSDDEVRYTVKTHTYFPGDDFFLGGFADDYIDDVYMDVGLMWQDWMWDTGSYGAIYAWGDGFMYPLGWRDIWHNMTFTFGEKWGSGLLDFQYISKTQQPDKIGKPKFYAETNFESGMKNAEVTEKKFYAGSMWYDETNPAKSKRYILTEQEFVFSDAYYGAKARLGIGVGWAYLTSTEFPDFGIMLNLTYISSIEGKTPFDYIFLTDNFADVYVPEPAFSISGVEFSSSGQSIVSPAWNVVERFSTMALVPIATYFAGPVGTVGGIYYKAVIDAEFDYLKDQVEAGVDQGGNSTCLSVGYNPFLGAHLSLLQTTVGTSNSHLLFIRLNPMSSGRCGAVKIVLHGYVGFHLPDFFELAKFTTAIVFPWFVN